MPFNFYDTHTLLMAVQQLTPAATFLRDRYFPTNDASDIFATDDVLVEFRDGSKKLAPFVAPRKGGVTVLRAGYNMERYTPPFVAPRRVLTLDELRKRGFGEALYSQLTPEQRQQTLILRDADELGELITNREEAMAAETMLTNGCVMKHIADDVDKADEMAVSYTHLRAHETDSYLVCRLLLEKKTRQAEISYAVFCLKKKKKKYMITKQEQGNSK